MHMGVFIRIGNNGWLISTTSPQYMPIFELDKTVVQRAEHHGMDFALSMIKLRGFGGASEFWDYNLQSFTLMVGLAAVTSKIKLFASTAVLTLPPTEYVQVMKDLWENEVSNFKGKHFTMEDCRMKPTPKGEVKIVVAEQGPIGMGFAAAYCDYNFVMAAGCNTPTADIALNQQLLDAVAKTGRDVGAYVLLMIIADETDELAQAKGRKYKDGVDVDALAWMADQGSQDRTTAESSTANINLPEQALNLKMGTVVGSYASVANMLDEASAVPGAKGIMLTFDDFVAEIEAFGERVQPSMQCRADRLLAAA